nr:polyprotein [Armillaria borealis tymo-like virus 1]
MESLHSRLAGFASKSVGVGPISLVCPHCGGGLSTLHYSAAVQDPDHGPVLAMLCDCDEFSFFQLDSLSLVPEDDFDPGFNPDPVIEYEFKDPKVGGAGNCYLLLPFVPTSPGYPLDAWAMARLQIELAEREVVPCTVSQLLSWLRRYLLECWVSGSGHEFYTRVQLDSDGDVHIQSVRIAFGSPVYGELTLQMLLEFLEDVLEFSKRAVLVGSDAAVSTYDTAYSRFVSPQNTQVLESYHFNDMQNAKGRLNKICPWSIPPKSRPAASRLKIPYSIMSPEPHPHPIHAAIRNQQIIDVIPDYLNAPTTVMWMSKSSFDLLQEFTTQTLTLLNVMLEVKDLGRYVKDGSFTDEVWRILKIDTPILYIHQAAHYFTQAALLTLYTLNPKLRMVILGHEFPLASVISPISPEPNLYRYFKPTPGVLVYIPENDWTYKYEQPDTDELLLTRTIYNPTNGLTINCGIVDTRLNSHIQVSTIYNLPGPKFAMVAVEDYMPMPQVFRSQPPSQMIPVRTYKGLYRYAKVLIGAKERDLWGKIRQAADDLVDTLNFTSTDLLVSVVMEVARFGVPKMPTKRYDTLAEKALYVTWGHVERLRLKWFTRKYYNRFAAIVNEPAVPLLIPLMDVRVLECSVEGFNAVWTVPPEFRGKHFTNAWLFIKKWWIGCAQKAQPLMEWENVEVDFDDHAYTAGFHFRSLSPRWMAELSAEEIEDWQRQDFLDVFKPERGNRRDMMKAARAAVDEIRTVKCCKKHEHVKDCEPVDLVEVDFSKKPAEVSRGEFVTMNVKQEFESEEIPLPQSVQNYLERRNAVKEVEESTVEVPTAKAASVLEAAIDISDPKVPKTVRFEDAVNASEAGKSFFKVHVEPKPEVEVKEDGSVHEPPTAVKVEPVEPQKKFTIPEIYLQNTNTTAPGHNKKEPWEKMYSSALKVPYIATGELGERKYDLMFPHTTSKRWQNNPAIAFTSFPLDLDYPKNDCLLECFRNLTQKRKEVLYLHLSRFFPKVDLELVRTDSGLSLASLEHLALICGLNVVLITNGPLRHFGVKEGPQSFITLKDGHFEVHTGRTKMAMAIKENSRYTQQLFLTNNAKKLIRNLNALPGLEFKEVVVEYNRAELLIFAYLSGFGLIGKNAANTPKLQSWIDLCKGSHRAGRTIQLAYIEGDPGCRKSSALQKILRRQEFQKSDAFQVITPLATLREDWARKLDVMRKHAETGKGTPPYYVCTFEKAIADGMSGVVTVLDEEKFPPGYVALKSFLHPRATHFVMLGDRYQTGFHDPSKDSLLNSSNMPSEADHYRKYTSQYLMGTYRFGGSLANFFQMPSWQKTDTKIFVTYLAVSTAESVAKYLRCEILEAREILKKGLVLSPADQDVNTADAVNDNENLTQTGSQGRDADLVIINFTETSVRASDVQTMYTAMTRAKKWVICCLLYARNNENMNRLTEKPILKALEWYKAATPEFSPIRVHPEQTVNVKMCCGDLPAEMKVLAGIPENIQNASFVQRFHPKFDTWRFIDPDAEVGGAAQLSFDEPAYKEAYTFKPYIVGYTDPPPPEPAVVDLHPLEVKAKTYLPHIEMADFEESQMQQVKERFDKELFVNGLYSEQFPDEYQIKEDADRLVKMRLDKENKSKIDWNKISDRLQYLADNAPESVYIPRILNTAQRQRNQDTASYQAGRDQRIKFATQMENEHAFRTDTNVYGPALFESLCEAMEWRPDVNVPWDEELYQQCILTFDARRANRSEAMKKASLNRSDPEFRNISLGKSQIKVKKEVAEKAKPLQTILIHSDAYLFELGPIGVYLLEMVLRHCPEHIYLHAKRSISEMDAWFATHWPNEKGGFESDMAHFDDSQDHNPLRMEEMTMEHFSIPRAKIDAYLRFKMNTPLGKRILAIARDSGELFTWLFNTLHTIARRHLKSIVPKKTPQGYGGDDEAHPFKYQERPGWSAMSVHSKMVEKEFVVGSLTFQGFIISRFGIVRDPEILLRKLLIAKEIGKLRDVWAGYFLEWSIAYSKGDLLTRILPEKEQEIQSLLTRTVFNIREFSDRQLAWTVRQRQRIRADRDVEREASSYLSFVDEILPTLVTAGTDFSNDALAMATALYVDVWSGVVPADEVYDFE